jgi:hypothetical protein
VKRFENDWGQDPQIAGGCLWFDYDVCWVPYNARAMGQDPPLCFISTNWRFLTADGSVRSEPKPGYSPQSKPVSRWFVALLSIEFYL